MKKLLKWLAFISWLVVIFLFSNQPHSGDVTHDIIGNLIPNLKTTNQLNTINFIIRKTAHIIEYLILTILTMSLLKEYTKKERFIIILSIIFCFIYACTDELHQSLVPGRTSQFEDVLIDTTGSLIGSIIYVLIKKIKKISKTQ